jgi:hypothetical protein
MFNQQQFNYHYTEAKNALLHVRNTLPFGSTNKIEDNMKVNFKEIEQAFENAKNEINQLAVDCCLKNIDGEFNLIESLAKIYQKHKVGNCGAQSFVANAYLKTKGIKATFCDLDDDTDHMFLYINDHIICDPWMDNVYLNFADMIKDLNLIGEKIDIKNVSVRKNVEPTLDSFFPVVDKKLMDYCESKVNSHPDECIEILSSPITRNKISDMVQSRIIEGSEKIALGLYQKGDELLFQLRSFALGALCFVTSKNNPEISIKILTTPLLKERISDRTKNKIFMNNQHIKDECVTYGKRVTGLYS